MECYLPQLPRRGSVPARARQGRVATASSSPMARRISVETEMRESVRKRKRMCEGEKDAKANQIIFAADGLTQVFKGFGEVALAVKEG
jgi:hypothetical protein